MDIIAKCELRVGRHVSVQTMYIEMPGVGKILYLLLNDTNHIT